jgi:hypothetical protein
MISELSAKKPTLAILTENALSAGYLLASAARQIVVPETGHCRLDRRRHDARGFFATARPRGVKVTLIASGAHKVDAHPALPLSTRCAAQCRRASTPVASVVRLDGRQFRGGVCRATAALATEAQFIAARMRSAPASSTA